jgi:hypothetical protein
LIDDKTSFAKVDINLLNSYKNEYYADGNISMAWNNYGMGGKKVKDCR